MTSAVRTHLAQLVNIVGQEELLRVAAERVRPVGEPVVQDRLQLRAGEWSRKGMAIRVMMLTLIINKVVNSQLTGLFTSSMVQVERDEADDGKMCIGELPVFREAIFWKIAFFFLQKNCSRPLPDPVGTRHSLQRGKHRGFSNVHAQETDQPDHDQRPGKS